MGSKALHAFMTYYEQLVQKMAKSMDENPNVTIALDANTLEVVSVDADPARLTRKIKRLGNHSSVVFQRPNPNHLMVL